MEIESWKGAPEVLWFRVLILQKMSLRQTEVKLLTVSQNMSINVHSLKNLLTEYHVSGIVPALSTDRVLINMDTVSAQGPRILLGETDDKHAPNKWQSPMG